MVDRSTVVWAPDPFHAESGNPRPWLVLAAGSLPYPDEESIAVAFSTQSHHPGSVAVPSEAWVRGEPRQRSYVFPWTVATLKDDFHVVGTQGFVTAEFTAQITDAVVSYVRGSDAV